MVLRRDGRDPGEQPVREAPEARSIPASAGGPAGLAGGDARVPAPRDRLPDGRSGEDARSAKPEGEQQAEDQSGDKPRKGLLSRHPIAGLIGVILLAAVAVAGYVYWDNARHFESTDDAFIAARQ